MSDEHARKRLGWRGVLVCVAIAQVLALGLYTVVERGRAQPVDVELVFERLDVELPTIELEQPDRRMSSRDLGKGFVLFHVWATWCRPCRAELPKFLALDGAVGAKVVAASVDEDWRVIDHYFDGAVPHVVWRLPAGQRALPVETLPATLLVRDGRIVARLSGSREWSLGAVRRLFADRRNR